MSKWMSLVFTVALAVVLPLAPSRGAEVTQADDFRLFDHVGGSHELSHYFNRKSVVIVSLNTQDAGSLEQIKSAAAYGAGLSRDEVAFLFLSGEPDLSRDAAAAFAKAQGIALPVLLDPEQLVHRTLGISRAAEALVMNPSDWSIVYRGAVRGPGGEAWLESAVGAFLKGEAPETALTEAVGATYTIPAPDAALSYSKDIAPIIEEKCGVCHRPDDIGPFSFSSFAVVKNYAPMIREVVLTRRMPPWHSDPHFGKYNHEMALSDVEKRKLIDWVDLGALRGEGPDVLAEHVKPRESKWELGEPDMVVSMSETVEIASEGVFDYKFFFETVDFGGEDRWVEAVEVLPGNRAVLHHSLIFLEYPEDKAHLKPNDFGGVGGYFAAWGPGYLPLPFPEGTAKFVPDGSTIIFQMHYTATGKPESDVTRLGLHFAKEEPKMEYVTRAASNIAIELPAHQEDIEYKGTYLFREPVYLYGLSPHMHLRGSRFQYVAEFPDGRRQTLLNVPYFDFNWQREYRLPEPMKMPAGSLLHCTGAYNNSVTNPNNPDPNDAVDWGNQSWDEMFIGHFSFAREGKTDPSAPKKVHTYATGLGEPITAESIVGSEWAVDMEILRQIRGGGDRRGGSDRGDRDDRDNGENRDGGDREDHADRDDGGKRDGDKGDNNQHRRRNMMSNLDASLIFAPNGVVIIGEVLSANWRFKAPFLTIDLGERQIMLNVKDDKLAFLGVELKRIVPDEGDLFKLSSLRE